MAEEQSSSTTEVTVIASNSDDEIPATQSEVIEAEISSDNVEIAQIEADKEVTIAAIHAETEQARIEAASEIVDERNKEIEECRREIAELTGTVEVLMEQVNSLIPPPQPEIVVTEELSTAPETDLIQPSIAAPTAETLTELSEESEEERQEEATLNRVRRFIAI